MKYITNFLTHSLIIIYTILQLLHCGQSLYLLALKHGWLFCIIENNLMCGSFLHAACMVCCAESCPTSNSGNSSDDPVQVGAGLWHMSGWPAPRNAAPHLQLHRSALQLGCKLWWVASLPSCSFNTQYYFENGNDLLADKSINFLGITKAG